MDKIKWEIQKPKILEGLDCRIQEDKTQKKTNIPEPYTVSESGLALIVPGGLLSLWGFLSMKSSSADRDMFLLRRKRLWVAMVMLGAWDTLQSFSCPKSLPFSLCLGQLWGARRLGGQHWRPHPKNRVAPPRQRVQGNTG